MDPVDFRKGIDGFAAVCRNLLEQDPYEGTLFLFRSRSKSSIKILVYDGQGFWLCTKRLSSGTFHWWPSASNAAKSIMINSWDLQTLLGNGNPSAASFTENWKKLPILKMA
jgi:hypothetical protein